MKTGVIYTRVSTDKQVQEGASLDTQMDSCQRWAVNNGVRIMATFQEEGVSAKTMDRPEIRKLLKYLNEHNGKVNYLIIYQYDRLSRETTDYFVLRPLLMKMGIEIRTVNSLLESTPTDEFIETIMIASAKLDNTMKSVRVKDNMQRQALQGYTMYHAPYGFRNARDDLGHPILLPVEGISEKIASLLTDFSRGVFTKRELLHEARRIGLTQANGKPMSYQTIHRLVTNPAYAGLARNAHTNNNYIPLVSAGIIQPSVFYKNQDLLSRRKASKTEGYVTNHPDFPLRRFLLCATCKKPVRGSTSTGGSGKKYSKYHCSSCKLSAINTDELHEQYLDLLTSIRPNPASLKLMKTLIVRVWNDEVRNLHQQRIQFQKRLDELQIHKQAAVDKVVAGEITPQEKIDVQTRTDQEISRLTAEVATLTEQMGTKQDAIDYALRFMENAPRLWNDATVEGKVKLQTMIFPDGIEYDFRTNKFGTLKFGALYRLANNKKDPSLTDESHLVTSWRIELQLPG